MHGWDSVEQDTSDRCPHQAVSLIAPGTFLISLTFTPLGLLWSLAEFSVPLVALFSSPVPPRWQQGIDPLKIWLKESPGRSASAMGGGEVVCVLKQCREKSVFLWQNPALLFLIYHAGCLSSNWWRNSLMKLVVTWQMLSTSPPYTPHFKKTKVIKPWL